jgi:hypothetical protein
VFKEVVVPVVLHGEGRVGVHFKEIAERKGERDTEREVGE